LIPKWILFEHVVYEGLDPPSPIGDVIQSSFSPSILRIIPKLNGFVHAVVEAYNEHRALILCPVDISHEGQSELVVSADGNQHTVDFVQLAKEMTGMIEKKVVDPALRTWIQPDFTTTTFNDTIIASIVMLATLKHYFSFRMNLRCGILCPQHLLSDFDADDE
jgi:hypothetical protein